MKQYYLRTCSACCAMTVVLVLQPLLLHVLQAKPLQEQFQQIRVSGTVRAQGDESTLPGVNIVVKGSSTGTVTDVEGRYSITVPDENDTLVFSSVGYTSQEIPVNGRSVIDVTLAEDIQSLEEVIVTGYMTQRKADLTGSVATISSEEIEKKSYANVMQGLQGRLPGVHITGDGSPVGNVQIRGLTSMSYEECWLLTA